MKARLWLRFYGRPLWHSAMIAIMAAVLYLNIDSALDGSIIGMVAAAVSAFVLGIYARRLHVWLAQYRRWKFQAYGRGSQHSV